MSQPEIRTSQIRKCPAENIYAYIDGELSAAAEIEFELHTAKCAYCSAAVRAEKMMLNEIAGSFEIPEDLEIPQDFTRRVVANAESSIKVHRWRTEVFIAGAAISGLLAIGLAAGDAQNFWGPLARLFERLAVLSTYLFYFLYSLAFGIAVFARSIFGAFSHFAHQMLLAAAAVVFAIGVISMRRIAAASAPQENK